MKLETPDRLKALPPYLFVEIDRKKRAAREAGKDVIDFGIGDPDVPTHNFIVERMAKAITNPSHHRYPRGEGAPEFRHAAAEYFHNRFGVRLDPEREIIAVIGTKEGLGHLPLAVLNPGQVALVPDPGYPVYSSATVFAGGKPVAMTLREERDWLPDLDAIPADVARAAVIMFINYPNNPTGATATMAFFEHAVAFARRHDILIVQDAAYSEMSFGQRPPSILEVPGAKEVAIELHSFSKTFNMTGWRLGFVAGHADVLAALARIKSNLDSGAFTSIQEAGIAALQGIDRPEIERTREMWRERAGLLSAGLRELGFRVRPPQATFYVWAGVPAGYDSMRVTNKLLDEAGVVCIPGTGFGAAGEGYVRFAVTVEINRIRTALERLRALKW